MAYLLVADVGVDWFGEALWQWQDSVLGALALPDVDVAVGDVGQAQVRDLRYSEPGGCEQENEEGVSFLDAGPSVGAVGDNGEDSVELVEGVVGWEAAFPGELDLEGDADVLQEGLDGEVVSLEGGRLVASVGEHGQELLPRVS